VEEAAACLKRHNRAIRSIAASVLRRVTSLAGEGAPVIYNDSALAVRLKAALATVLGAGT
jgi:hypothetical protein